MYKIGLSINPVGAGDELFRNMSAAGITQIEISFGVKDRDQGVDYKALKKSANANGVELWSFHLPFGPCTTLDPSLLDDGYREDTIKFFTEQIKAMSDLGIAHFVIHPSGEPIPDKDRAERLKLSCESLARLSKVASSCGSVLCVEDLPRTCLGHNTEEITQLISSDDALRVCFDTNHLLIDNNLNFINNLGKKIVTTHVSDYDFKDEKHWLPGEGSNDWPAIVDALEKVGYDGVWLYELGFEKPTRIITRDRLLTCEDFARNAKEIFSRSKITNISRPIEG